ncbi:MAG: hypothetical protein WBA25_15435 [Jannaschia sp.]
MATADPKPARLSSPRHRADPDDPAVALYSGLGIRADVLHFDIPPRPETDPPG